MTQKNKELLLKDLCARLPYGLKVKIKHYDDVWELLAIYTNGTTYATRDVGYPIETYFEDCKPFLFPLSSMTAEQKEFIKNNFCYDWDIDDHPYSWWAQSMEIGDVDKLIDWFHKNHFDYRGLIERGVANDATGLNIY